MRVNLEILRGPVLAVRDRAGRLGPLEAHALLAEVDDVPPLLGVSGALTKLVLHVHLAAAWRILRIRAKCACVIVPPSPRIFTRAARLRTAGLGC